MTGISDSLLQNTKLQIFQDYYEEQGKVRRYQAHQNQRQQYRKRGRYHHSPSLYDISAWKERQRIPRKNVRKFCYLGQIIVDNPRNLIRLFYCSYNNATSFFALFRVTHIKLSQ